MKLLSKSPLTLSLALCSLAAVANNPIEIESVLNDHKSIDYGSTLSVDGTKMYFTHAEPKFQNRMLMVANLNNGKVDSMSPLLVGNQTIVGGDVQISPDGKTLTFCSDMAIGRNSSRKDRDLFYATKTKTGWSEPKRFPETINTENNEFYPVLTNSGNLYFSRMNKETSMDLYVSEFVNGEYKNAKKLGPKINTKLLESDAYFAPDESFMVFVRMYEEGAYGVSDMYLSFNENGNWSTPINLGHPFNFEGVDGSPFVTQDKKWLYFTSNRDAIEPTKFDSHLGIFRLPFKGVYEKLKAGK